MQTLSRYILMRDIIIARRIKFMGYLCRSSI